MPNILDDLEEVLGKDQIAKIKANRNVSYKLGKADEMLDMYLSDDDLVPPKTEDDPPARRAEGSSSNDLSTLTKTLTEITAKLGDVPTKKGTRRHDQGQRR
jgi:hypothetical protein